MPNYIGKLTKLQTLNIEGNPITNDKSEIEKIKNIITLKNLYK